MRTLIGHTGFVGSSLANQFDFDKFYNSKNILDISNCEHDLVVCSGISSVKWKANKNPKEDYQQIDLLIKNLEKTKIKKFILISTIAVYDNPADNAYGQNRLYAETYLKNKFDDIHVIRLPSLFGHGLRKNAIFDLLHKERSFLPSKNSIFQYYNVEYLWSDIQKAIQNNIRTLNISTEPVLFSEVLKLFGESEHKSNKSPHFENMKSNYGHLWGSSNSYLYSRNHVLNDLEKFINEYE